MKDVLIAQETQVAIHDYVTERNKPMPSLNHAKIQANIIFLMMLHYKKIFTVVSELSFDLSDWVSVPDVSLLPLTKYDAKNDQIKVLEPPLCTVEILSPTQSLSELVAKSRSYFDKDVKSCWIVFPELENVYVFSSPDNYKIFVKGDILKDEIMQIELNINEIFE